MTPGGRGVRGLAPLLLALILGCSGQDRPGETAGGAAADASSTLPSRGSLTDAELGQVERSDLQLALAWTRGPTRRPPPGAGESATLRTWEVRGRERFDRLLLTFGPDDPMPGYEVAFVEGPVRRCGSDAELEVRARAFLRVRLSAVGPGPELETDPSIRARRNLRELHLVCRTGDALEFVLALNGERDYRILEARTPRRLVVDVDNTTQDG